MAQNLSSAAVVIGDYDTYLSNWTLRYGEAVGRVLYSVTLCTSWTMLNWSFKLNGKKEPVNWLVLFVSNSFF